MRNGGTMRQREWEDGTLRRETNGDENNTKRTANVTKESLQLFFILSSPSHLATYLFILCKQSVSLIPSRDFYTILKSY
jgi:hypothetical protein